MIIKKKRNHRRGLAATVHVVIILLISIILLWSIQGLISDCQEAQRKVNVSRLNRRIPSASMIEEMIQAQYANAEAVFPQNKSKKLMEYYEMVNTVISPRADAYGLAAFYAYHCGQHQKAKDYYEKALQMNSTFFWYHYNLGIIYLKEKSYERAAMSFQKALKTSPQDTMRFILNSRKIYLPIIAMAKNHFAIEPQDQLQQGFQNSYRFLQIISEHGKTDYPRDMNLPKDDLFLMMF